MDTHFQFLHLPSRRSLRLGDDIYGPFSKQSNETRDPSFVKLEHTTTGSALIRINFWRKVIPSVLSICTSSTIASSEAVFSDSTASYGSAATADTYSFGWRLMISVKILRAVEESSTIMTLNLEFGIEICPQTWLIG